MDKILTLDYMKCEEFNYKKKNSKSKCRYHQGKTTLITIENILLKKN